jgi:hypothetical protein
MTNDLETLQAACAGEREEIGQRLAIGPTRWFAGKPAPSAPGTVALALGDLTLVFAEKDLLQVRKQDELFFVKVASDANFLLRLEAVFKAEGSPPGCDCEVADVGRASLRSGLYLGEVTICRRDKLCITIFGRNFCIDVIVCGDDIRIAD